MLGLAVFAVALGVYVDPYRMYGTNRLALTPRIYEQSDLAKTYLLERSKPRTLLLGNSRVEIGLDPESSSWPEELKPVFNAAEAGRGLFTARLFLQHDLAIKAPQLVIVGADYPDFLSNQSPAAEPGPNSLEARLRTDRNGKPHEGRALLQLWKDFVTSTLTIDAVYDSLVTILDQDPKTATTMTQAGFNPLHEYRAVERHEGYYSVFAQKQSDYITKFNTLRPSDFADPLRNREFIQLAQIVKATTDHSARIVVFIPPYHMLYLEMLRRLGYWQSFEDWKRALVRVVDNASAGRRDLVQIYDFSGYDDISTEALPPPGDRQHEMRWY